MANNESKIPKAYYYSVEDVLQQNGEDLKRFIIASLGRDLNDEFDLEGLGNSAALSFYLENEDYRDESKWPLTFKFYTTLKAPPVELEMNLSYSPCFLSTPKKIIITKEAETSAPAPKPKRRRKVKEIQDETTVQDQVSEQEVSDSSNDVSE